MQFGPRAHERRRAEKSDDVNTFLFLERVYWMAEPLPDVADSIAQDVELPDGICDHSHLTEWQYDRSLQLYSESAAADPTRYIANVGPSDIDTEGTRYLPPGTWWEQYLLYRTYADDRSGILLESS